MAIKFEKIKPGMVLYDRQRQTMGNTTLKTLGEWSVWVIEVNPEARRALCSWNSNPPRIMREWSLSRLFTWSMYDPKVAELHTGPMGQVYGVTKKKKGGK